ncbi:hypothetical protein GQ44DRAFT_666124 [Phaeosphaeriaceae sp. PMI808]|nr:hypothetical protein GQ44DRAFT_666124 [Phaeosphaeriaceae sp. PMI808]
MDDLLPSYENAIHQDPWVLIAPYLPSDSLCPAALVCRKWHQIMTPQLWGNPASHFGAQNDTVYVALTRFKRILPYVRLFVRELTHTLQFPPAHSEIYGGPHAEWLRDCLEYLPRLQCLLVNGLPFFDHSSLLSLRHASLRRKSTHPLVYPIFGLRLLDASGCTNATSTGLAEALSHFPNLVSLDLSRTPAAKDQAVLSKLRSLVNLRLLSLQGLGLKDAEFEILALSIGTRVRSLDMSNNSLTDVSARSLLGYCLKGEVIGSHRTRGPLSPIEYGPPDGDFDTFESEDIVGHVRQKLTKGFASSLTIETVRDVGITHLYLSNNLMTVEGISGLVRSKRLQVLDVGTLHTLLERPYSTSADDVVDDIELPGASKLTRVLSEYAAAKLRYLRINHEIITKDTPLSAAVSPRAELFGGPDYYAPQDAHELDTIDTMVNEIPGDFLYPAELPGSSPTPARTQAQSSSNSQPVGNVANDLAQSPTVEVTVASPEIKPSAAYAPEPILVDSPHNPDSPFRHYNIHDAQCDQARTRDSVLLSPISPIEEMNPRILSASPTKNRSRHNSTYYVEDRRAQLQLRQSQENCLHPNMLPKVHTLVLTDVPSSTRDVKVINRLIQYITDAAEEASIARQRAERTYVLPPGRCRAVAEREHAHSLFSLRRIVLEMAPPRAAPKKVSTSWRAYPTKSSTEDADSEAFWEAATYDFSFFCEEECGLPDIEPGRTLPLAAMSGLMVAPKQPVPYAQPNNDLGSHPSLDVVGEIAKFREDRKATYNSLVQQGGVDLDVEGHWPGILTVIKNSLSQEAGELDCYGNRYESGWNYR